MSAEELRGLVERARKVVRAAEKASTGPWRKFRSDYGNDTIAIMQGDEPDHDERGYHVGRWRELVTWMGFDGADTSETKKHANARAICAAVNFVRDDLPSLLSQLDDLKADKARLDFLDECNRRLNATYGTEYGWSLILNHNVNRLMLGHMHVDLHDNEGGNAKLPSCRAAIDACMEALRSSSVLKER